MERSESAQANNDRLVVVYLFFYNDGPSPWKVRHFSLLDPDGKICPVFRNGGPANFSVSPHGVTLVSPSYTFKGDQNLPLTLLCNEKPQDLRVQVAPQSTTSGSYLSLSTSIRATIEGAIQDNPAFRWWGTRQQ